MNGSINACSRVTVDGKFFRLGEGKFFVKGVTYGPFAPDAGGQPFPSPAQVERDFDQVCDLGANVVRVYTVPPRWVLDLAAARGLRLLVDVPWARHECFLDSAASRAAAREAVRTAVTGCAAHPALFAICVANEIPPDVVRWSGPRRVAAFLDELVAVAKEVDPQCLCTFTNYPPTEFLRPRRLDFVSFNVYLHHRQPFRNYLARLQMIAGDRPLVLGEFGMDSVREGESAQAEFLAWQIEYACRAGLAGAIVFSFTDDWFSDGRVVEDWAMGVTTRQRAPKPAFRAVQQAFAVAPRFPLARWPRVSVVVASYNGASTLEACLESLDRLNYPDYEVILVDDGSTDDTPRIAARHPRARCVRHAENRGLSAARNSGIAAATGEIVAFLDADCRADADWLYYLVGELLNSAFVGMGGPNLLPPEDSPVAAAVMASPGGPAPVMITDRQAEHLPGCNMAFYKWALEEVGGFDPMFRQAGDDVDLCWRLQQAGYKLGFSPAAVVWHYRRSTVRAYLRQQRGYGEAEALLVRKHPEYFNFLGGGLWRGRIYAAASPGVLLQRPLIYHGQFGTGWFQTLYAAPPTGLVMFFTSLEFHLGVTLPLAVLSAVWRGLLPLVVAALALSVGVCATAAAQAYLPPDKVRWWSRPLVGLLFFLQPLVRGWARHRGRLGGLPGAHYPEDSLDSVALRGSGARLDRVDYWSERPFERLAFLGQLMARLEQRGWPHKADTGWNPFDLEVHGRRWAHVRVTTVVEVHPRGRRLLRCRLQPTWSLSARVLFWGLLWAELLTLGLWARSAWLWLALLALPALGWWFHHEGRRLQSVLVILLDELAAELGWVKLTPSGPDAAGHATTAGAGQTAAVVAATQEEAAAADARSPFREPQAQS